MYYLIYVSFDPSASLYENNVIDFHNSGMAFDTLEEAQEYIKEDLVINMKEEASEGMVGLDEIDVEYHQRGDKVTLDAFYDEELILRYECWIMKSL